MAPVCAKLALPEMMHPVQSSPPLLDVPVIRLVGRSIIYLKILYKLNFAIENVYHLNLIHKYAYISCAFIKKNVAIVKFFGKLCSII